MARPTEAPMPFCLRLYAAGASSESASAKASTSSRATPLGDELLVEAPKDLLGHASELITVLRQSSTAAVASSRALPCYRALRSNSMPAASKETKEAT